VTYDPVRIAAGRSQAPRSRARPPGPIIPSDDPTVGAVTRGPPGTDFCSPYLCVRHNDHTGGGCGSLDGEHSHEGPR